MAETQLTAVTAPVEALTRREREILALLDQGLSAPEIARQLSLATSSVKWHIQQVYAKLGVNRRQQALLRARTLGLLAPQPAPPAAAPRHNLPLALTRFFGRELELTQIKELLTEHRLVTITGAGGVGKTRLSLRMAETLLADFHDGVWLVELAAVTEPALVAQSVAVALGVRNDPGRPILESLIVFLRQRQLLLVLDNCEHLLKACAQLAEGLLRACPRLTLLTTSREPLGGEGEAVFPAPSLPYPDPSAPLPLEQLNTYPAVRLFADRARMVLPNYQITPVSAAQLARVCQRLDGVPLALEMAAARMNILSMDQLAVRLDDAFQVLTSGRSTVLPRQQTLRATLDWSYDLLSEPERLLLQRLSVFAGGCTLEAAEAVCPGAGLEPGQVVAALGTLSAKSLMTVDRRLADQTRYRLLEMVRQYAAEKLEAAGDTARLRRRHRDYFMPNWDSDVVSSNSQPHYGWPQNLAFETDNLRLAVQWSFDDPTDIEAGPRLVLAIDNRWPSHQEYIACYARAVVFCDRQPDMPAELHASLLRQAAVSLSLNDPQTAIIGHQRSVEIGRRLGAEGKAAVMWNLYVFGNHYLEALRDVEHALPLVTEAETLFRELYPEEASRVPARSTWLNGFRAFLKGHIAKQQGQYLLALVHAGESIRIYEDNDDNVGSVRSRVCMGEAYLGLGEFERARTQFLAGLHLRNNPSVPEALGEKAYALRWVGMAELRAGRLPQARDYGHDSLRLAAQVPDRNIIASGLGLEAHIEAAEGHALRAATLSGASAAMWHKQGRKPWDDASLDTLLPAWHERPDQAALAEAYATGQAMEPELAVSYALGGPTL